MSIYGEQWECGCGWSNVFLRAHCRNCSAPREEAMATTDALEVVERVHRPAPPPSLKKAREDGE